MTGRTQERLARRNDVRLFLLALALLAVVSAFSVQRIMSATDQLELTETNSAVHVELSRLQFAIAQAEKAQLAYFLSGGSQTLIASHAARVSDLLDGLRPDLVRLDLASGATEKLAEVGVRWRRRHLELDQAATLFRSGQTSQAVDLALGIDDKSNQEVAQLLSAVTADLIAHREAQRDQAQRQMAQALIAPILGIGIITAFGLHYFRRYAASQAEHEQSIRDLTASKTNLEHSVLQRNAELEELAAQLKEANEHKDQFMAMLGHELRNPLAPMVSAAEYLLHGEPNAKEVHDSAVLIHGQCRRMTRLVNDLMDVGQIATGKMRFDMGIVDLRAIVDSIARASTELAASQHVHLRLDIPEGPVWVRGDGDRLGQITENLLNNALKFTEPDDEIRVNLMTRDDWASLTVEDSGAGMAPEMAQRVFEPFYRVEREDNRGLGLGLAIVRDVVAAHSGRVQAASDGPGKGTRIVIELPVYDGPPPKPKEIDVVPPKLPALHFLVVDDYSANAESLGELLKVSGHRVSIASNGERAIEAYKTERPDVVLLDLGLPDMDGVDVGSLIMRLDPEAVVIAVTGMGHDSILEKTRAAGFAAHLTKPVRLAQLMTTVAGAIDHG